MAPPSHLHPKPPVRFVHMRYCFEARLNRTWATDGIFEFPFLSSKNWHFCDFNKRAIIHPLTVNYSGLDKNFKNPFGGPSSIDTSFQTIPHMTKLGKRFGL